MPASTETTEYPALAELDARRAAQRRQVAIQRAREVLALLEGRGIEGKVVGSLGRGDFRADSDVDFLILSLARPEDRYAVEGEIIPLMGDLPFDVIYLDEVRSEHFRDKLLKEARGAADLA